MSKYPSASTERLENVREEEAVEHTRIVNEVLAKEFPRAIGSVKLTPEEQSQDFQARRQDIPAMTEMITGEMTKFGPLVGTARWVQWYKRMEKANER